MDFDSRLRNLAVGWGADYFGVADLTVAQDAILEQGGDHVAAFPRAISIGIALFHPIVDQLSRKTAKSAAISYKSHCYDIINDRLDRTISRLASVMQREGHRVHPVPASKRIDNERLCAVFSHKLGAHLAGLGWIGKNCLLITPDMGPRVRWAALLTDAPLTPTKGPENDGCGDCRECVDICPVRAFTGEPFRPQDDRAVRFDAGKCDRYFAWMKEKDTDTAVCGLCLAVCPHGNHRH